MKYFLFMEYSSKNDHITKIDTKIKNKELETNGQILGNFDLSDKHQNGKYLVRKCESKSEIVCYLYT